MGVSKRLLPIQLPRLFGYLTNDRRCGKMRVVDIPLAQHGDVVCDLYTESVDRPVIASPPAVPTRGVLHIQ